MATSPFAPKNPNRTTVKDTFQTPATPPAEKKVNTSVWLSVDTRQALKVCAAKNNTTISALLEEGAKKVLDKYDG